MTSTGPSLTDLLDDLRAEHESLDRIVRPLTHDQWHLQTPASGWDVADTISHLCFFDEAATLAMDDPPEFELWRDSLVNEMGAGATPDVNLGRDMANEGALMERWRTSRQRFVETASKAGAVATPPRVAWFGPPMSLASFVTARIMETWAHGIDVRDAMGLALEHEAVSPRLRHVCHLAFGARAFTFAVHGIEDPGDPVAFEVGAPDGSVWIWGPQDSEQRITGTSLDIALVFTQRRHPSRTGVKASGPTAKQWLAIAQAFAGPPTIAAEDR